MCSSHMFKLIGCSLLTLQSTKFVIHRHSFLFIIQILALLQSIVQIFHLEGKHIDRQLVHNLTQNWSALAR